MKSFVRTLTGLVFGVLSGFDRPRFRGTLRWLAYTNGMQWFLNSSGVLLKEFKTYVQGVTDKVLVAKAVQQELGPANRFQESSIGGGPGLQGPDPFAVELGGLAEGFGQLSQGLRGMDFGQRVQIPLRAHGLILKVVHTHRYQLTARGRTILVALQAARQANPQQLAKLAA